MNEALFKEATFYNVAGGAASLFIVLSAKADRFRLHLANKPRADEQTNNMTRQV